LDFVTLETFVLLEIEANESSSFYGSLSPPLLLTTELDLIANWSKSIFLLNCWKMQGSLWWSLSLERN